MVAKAALVLDLRGLRDQLVDRLAFAVALGLGHLDDNRDAHDDGAAKL